MKRKSAYLLSSVVLFGAVQASTVAYWRFEGPVGEPVAKNGPWGFPNYTNDVADSSGNGNYLTVWNETDAGYTYNASVAGPWVQGVGANTSSVRNRGGYPAMWAASTTLTEWQPSSFTIEFYFMPENVGPNRTVVGRDSYGGYADIPGLSNLYIQLVGGSQNILKFMFVDVDGNLHQIESAPNLVKAWNFSDGQETGVWQHVAAVSDGSEMRLYLDGNLVASGDLGTGDTRLGKGQGSGRDWAAGNFSVGRGLWDGGHVDRAYGLIDEVRFSDEALSPDQFLRAVPEPSVSLLGALGLLGLLRRRRG